VDADGDGFAVGPPSCGEADCDDTDPAVNPGAVEACNGTDDDCNGTIDDGIPPQTCGVGACAATVPGCMRGAVPTCTPGGPKREVCNAIDDDCDGTFDEGLGAPIVCGTGACQRMVPSCSGGGMMTCTPGAPSPETCNGIDDDCNGMVDDGLGSTMCGVGACVRTTPTCSGGMPRACVPGTPSAEVCNGLDDNCNGAVDDGFGTTSCGVGYCARTMSECVMGVPQTCTPGAPRVETCNNLDDDCNGMTDDGLGTTTCGLGACGRTVSNCVAGVPQTCTPGSSTPEVCNTMDDDCNGAIDDMGSTSCGIGVCSRTVSNCVGGVLQTCVPGTPAAEICGNGLDENCNGVVDDGCVTAPPNDTCASATTLSATSGTRTGDSFNAATREVIGCGSGPEIWYRITLGARSILYVDTFGSSFDTALSIRSSCGGAAVSCENDDCAVAQDQAVADLPAGTHFIAVHAFSAATSSGTVNLRWETLALGNGPSSRVTANGTFSGTTSGAGLTSASCNGTGPENVYYFTVCPSTTRSVTASTCTGTSWDSVLYIRNAAATELACNDDFCGLQSSVTASTTGPGVFGVFVDGYFGASGAYALTISGL
jgi:hypothetical protein